MLGSKIIIGSLATLATMGVLAAPQQALAAPQQHVTSPVPSVVTSTARGGSQLGRSARGSVMADKATQVTMSITNSTQESLTLTSAQSKGSHNHWQDRPVNLAPGQKETVSNYAAGDAEIDLTYTGAVDGAVFSLHGETPLVGYNTASGSTTNPSYTVDADSATGYDPTFTYSMEPGHTFAFTGHTETYTVPAGVTALKVTAIGGASGDIINITNRTEVPSGAEITGTLAVTPGEVLTVGVGGSGNEGSSNSLGGWGMTAGGSSFSGGNGIPGNTTAGGGGGATVIETSTGQLLLVAGGAGGMGAVQNGTPGYEGGQGGAGGSLTGGNGDPGVNAGGKPGANTVSQGQDAQSGGEGAGGAGGGGLAGGMAGISGTGGGGGAGSSSDAALTNPTINPAPHSDGNITAGEVIFSAAN